ncbi:MAG: integrase [Sphingobacteriales bacterium]|nr:MAG: integrase [Sphingobacteriales bacterium]
MTMMDAQEAFFRLLRYEKRYSPNTLAAYEGDLRSFSDWLQLFHPTLERWDEVTYHQVRGWLAQLRLKDQMQPRSVNRKRATLSSFFQYLLREDLIRTNPVRKGHAMKVPERLPIFLKETESERLLDEVQYEEGFAGDTEKLALEILYGCGLRRSELISLTEADVQSSNLLVHGKGGKERLVPLSPALQTLIRQYTGEKHQRFGTREATLLVTEKGEPLYPVWVYRTVKKYLSLVCSLKRKSPHVLRHSFATHLLTSGANIQAIRDLLGHSSLSATQVYTHADIEALKDMHRRLHPRG